MLQTPGQDDASLLRSYLREVLGANPELRSCADVPLPVFLAHAYTFTCGRIFGSEYVFAAPSDTDPYQGPLWHAKQQEKLSGTLGRPVVLVFNSLSGRDRQRLVQKRAPFIVPFKQMYLPTAGVDFREWALDRHVSPQPAVTETFTPITQQVLLYALLRGGRRELHAQELVRQLRISAMSVSRAFKDLEVAQLVVRRQHGRNRPACLAAEERVVWEKAQPFLVTPVRIRRAVTRKHIHNQMDAGLTALSQISNLAAPMEQTVAVGVDEWRRVRNELPAEPMDAAFAEPGQMTVEVWTYSPRTLSDERRVDLLSLYLSLRDVTDERVQLATGEAMKEVRWL